MSEPNDTAQEGFDQLKRNLEVRYPEDSDLSLDEFLNVESLLALAVRVCGPGADPRKADRLLSNYQLIRPETIGADELPLLRPTGHEKRCRHRVLPPPT